MSIYLDYNATTPLNPSIKAKMSEWLELVGNPSSIHSVGREAKVALENARAQVADALGVSPMEVLFTSGGTEANNWALFQILRFHSAESPAHIIISAVEHSCVMNAARYLADRGVGVSYAAPDANGFVSEVAVRQLIRPNTRLISVMAANNEVGTVQPITKLAALAESQGILFHSDCVQALGKVPIDFQAPGVSMAAISGHKIGALKGIGALIARNSDTLTPWTFGGGHEYGKRSGTENLIGALSLGDAMAHLSQWANGAWRTYIAEFEHRLTTTLPDLWTSRTEPDRTLPNTLCIAHPAVTGRRLMMNLDLAGISVSTGSACATGSIEPSHVLQAMQLPHWVVAGAVRISIGPETTRHELMQAADEIEKMIKKL